MNSGHGTPIFHCDPPDKKAHPCSSVVNLGDL
jgi:hypothetical protein